MKPFEDNKQSICEALLENGRVVEYDFAVSVDWAKKNKKKVSNYKKTEIFLGKGQHYSVNGVLQKLDKEYSKILFFNFA